MNLLEDDRRSDPQGAIAGAVEAPEHSEESVDDYFARLMERVQRGVSTAAGDLRLTSEPRVAPVERSERLRERDASVPVEVVPEPNEVKQPALTELTPLRPSLENVTDRAKMREVANRNARGATATHFQKLARREYYTLGLAGCTIGVSFLLLELSRYNQPSLTVAACGTIGLSFWITARFFAATRRLAALIPSISNSAGQAGESKDDRTPRLTATA